MCLPKISPSYQTLPLRALLTLSLWLCVGLLCAGLLVACGAAPATLSLLFDLPPPGQTTAPAPVVRLPRRVPFVDPAVEEAKRYQAMLEERAKAPPPANWAEMFKRLPKDDDDNIDWMAALKDKIIAPSGTIDPAVPDDPSTSDDEIELSTSGKPARMVVFSHEVHTQWLTCSNCHPAIFKRSAGTAKITMAAIDDGKYCGVCHDTVAIAQPSGCKGCHKPKPKPKA